MFPTLLVAIYYDFLQLLIMFPSTTLPLTARANECYELLLSHSWPTIKGTFVDRIPLWNIHLWAVVGGLLFNWSNWISHEKNLLATVENSPRPRGLLIINNERKIDLWLLHRV